MSAVTCVTFVKVLLAIRAQLQDHRLPDLHSLTYFIVFERIHRLRVVSLSIHLLTGVAVPMSQNWIYINSPAYRTFVNATRSNKLLFWGVTAGLFGASMVAGSYVMYFTNPETQDNSDTSSELAKLPLQSQVQARESKRQLQNMIRGIQCGKDDAQYRAMLDGKLYGTKSGTSMPDS